jgi:hypothetical protein
MVRVLSAGLVAAFFVAVLHAEAQPRVRSLEDQSTDPFAASAGAKAIVFLFVSVECPISNRYAPEVRRLYEKFSARGVEFRLVYPNPAESPDAIRRHLADFSYPARALRDPRHELVKATGVTITPEAAVYDQKRKVVYRGRIDDRYVNLGLERPAATRHDLDDALTELLAGRPVRQPAAPAVGCFIADFVQ